MKIGKKLEQARKTAKINQTQLAELINVKQQHVNRWEKNERTPSLENFTKICKALKISADEILEINTKKE